MFQEIILLICVLLRLDKIKYSVQKICSNNEFNIEVTPDFRIPRYVLKLRLVVVCEMQLVK